MPSKLIVVRRQLLFLFLLCSVGACASSSGQPAETLTAAQAQALVSRALATEMRAAQDISHPMRYRLHKSSQHLTSTKEIIETRDGAVARLVSLFDKPLSAADEQKEQARLSSLLSDPGLQRHRKQGESEDFGIVMKLLRMLPQAFVYQYAGTGVGPNGPVERFSFRPNPRFSPPDLETQALTAMSGELWIDPAQERVTRLEGHLQQDADYGWGILGKLDKGGWVVLDQADIGGHQWRIVHFRMVMSLRILFKSKSFDTSEEMSQYTPVPPDLGYQQAIRLLRDGASGAIQGSR